MLRGIVTDNDPTNCNCLYGTPYVSNGQCLCDNGGGMGVANTPPMPATTPPVGFYWAFVNTRWVLMRNISVASGNTNTTSNLNTFNPLVPRDNGIIQNVINWGKKNPYLAAGLAISIYVAFIKKNK